MRLFLLLILAMLSTKSSAQELFVFSEIPLLAPGAVGKLGCDSLAAWQDAAPISPAVEQGGSLTMVIAVVADPGKPFLLDVGQNPASSFPLRVHRVLTGIDDAATPVPVPLRFNGRVFENQRCALFLLQVGVPAALPVGRIKLEPAVWVPNPQGENFWMRYPMEVRVLAGAKSGDAKTLECPAASSRIEAILLHAIPRLTGACVADAERPGLAARVRELRRLQGKNQ
jgi:hypothetical protein